MTAPTSPMRARSIAWRAAAIAAPWLWFLVRGIGGPVDGIAVAIPVFGLLAAIVMFILAAAIGRPTFTFVGFSIVAATLVATLGPRVPQSSEPPVAGVAVAAANVYESNPTPEAAIETLLNREADVVVAVEMQGDFWNRLEAQPALPYGVRRGELGVRSRWPVEKLETPGNLNSARVLRARVATPSGSMILYVVHASNPLYSATFDQQRDLVDRLLADIAEETEPTVLVGDLNLSDRTTSYRALTTQLRDAMRTSDWPSSTYHGEIWPVFQLRIDHMMIPMSWCGAETDTFNVPGSDHNGIVATVGPCPVP